jgi:hypothetical protein
MLMQAFKIHNEDDLGDDKNQQQQQRSQVAITQRAHTDLRRKPAAARRLRCAGVAATSVSSSGLWYNL